MRFADKTLEEIGDELQNSDFQWIKGENLGQIEKYSGVTEQGGMKFVIFKSGERMNVQVLEEFMDIFPASPINLGSLQTPEAQFARQPESPQQKGKVNSINYGAPVSGVEESPIYKLLKKQKPNWVNINISLKLNLPTKSLYNVLITSFEDADQEIANYVTEGIDIEDIRQAIAESIRSSFYDSKKSSSPKETVKKSIEEDEISES